MDIRRLVLFCLIVFWFISRLCVSDCYPPKQAKDSLEYFPSHSFQSASKKLIRALLNDFPNGQIFRKLNNLQANDFKKSLLSNNQYKRCCVTYLDQVTNAGK